MWRLLLDSKSVAGLSCVLVRRCDGSLGCVLATNNFGVSQKIVGPNMDHGPQIGGLLICV